MPDFIYNTKQECEMKKNNQILIGIIVGLLFLLFLGVVVLAASLIVANRSKSVSTSAAPTLVVEIPTSAPTQAVQPTATPLPAPTAKKPTAMPTSKPKPTAKATPTAKPTSAPTETKPKAIVTAQLANLRAGPGIGYKIITQAPKGTQFTIVARDKTGKWWGVLLESGDIAWLYGELAEVQGDTSKVPELIIPQGGGSPTATPKPQPSETPTPSPAKIGGKLAFPVFDPTRGTYDIYVLDMGTKSARRVIDYASEPSLSPDGAHLAFRRWKSDDRGIEVMDTFGGNRRRLTNFFEDGLPDWSPDSKTLVFFSRRESDRGSRIYMVDVSVGSDWVLRRGPNAVFGEYPSWTPSGRVVYRSIMPQVGVGILNNDGNGFSMIVGDGDATAPAVSPDGRKIAFMSKKDGNWEIYVVGINGSGLKRLTANGANDGLPAWSPDGETIAFVSDRSGHWSIWLMNPDGSNQREFYVLPGSIDGHVKGEPDYASRGWVEERISWRR